MKSSDWLNNQLAIAERQTLQITKKYHALSIELTTLKNKLIITDKKDISNELIRKIEDEIGTEHKAWDMVDVRRVIMSTINIYNRSLNKHIKELKHEQ